MDEAQLQAVRRLLALVDRYHLSELVVEEEGVTVTIRGSAEGAPARSTDLPAHDMPAAEGEHAWLDAHGAASSVEEALVDDGLFPLLSPMTGLFFRSPSPEARSYVEPGDVVEEGQTVGLIEAMKVFSEIPADTAGRVTRILVENGTLVTQGEPLMLLEPLDETDP
jgi:acetyl-CoA carboxylase biotin carboxyl carrier protein